MQTDVVEGLAGAEVQSDDPDAMAKRWGAALGVPVEAGDEGPVLRFDEGGFVRFVPIADDRGEGVSALAFRARDADAARTVAKARGLLDAEGRITACGVRIELVDSD